MAIPGLRPWQKRRISTLFIFMRKGRISLLFKEFPFSKQAGIRPFTSGNRPRLNMPLKRNEIGISQKRRL